MITNDWHHETLHTAAKAPPVFCLNASHLSWFLEGTKEKLREIFFFFEKKNGTYRGGFAVFQQSLHPEPPPMIQDNTYITSSQTMATSFSAGHATTGVAVSKTGVSSTHVRPRLSGHVHIPGRNRGKSRYPFLFTIPTPSGLTEYPPRQ